MKRKEPKTAMRARLSLAGKSGTGASKDRGAEHYQKMVAARRNSLDESVVKAIRAKWASRKLVTPNILLKDIAKENGVSISCISRIVSNQRRNSI